MSGLEARETSGQKGAGVPKAVLDAFINVFGARLVLEISPNYFRRQQI